MAFVADCILEWPTILTGRFHFSSFQPLRSELPLYITLTYRNLLELLPDDPFTCYFEICLPPPLGRRYIP